MERPGVSDRPILFSAPMVRALLAGTKTQTRRTLRRARVFGTPETKAFTLSGDNLARALQGADRFRHLCGDGWFWEADAFEWQAPATRTGWMAHIGYAPGERLWVKETHAFHWATDDQKSRDMDPELWSVRYIADDFIRPASRDGSAALIDQCKKLRPSIFMPRWASRITLTVTDVRVERLQDISEADVLAEGAPLDPNHRDGTQDGSNPYMCVGETPHTTQSPRAWYHHVWDSINGAGAWDANPWVVAVSFDVRKGNIDA